MEVLQPLICSVRDLLPMTLADEGDEKALGNSPVLFKDPTGQHRRGRFRSSLQGLKAD
jgi:hypothetical protein